MAEVSVQDIKRFMARHPPVRPETKAGIDQIIVDNAKILLAYQAEIKAKSYKDAYCLKHYKHCKLP